MNLGPHQLRHRLVHELMPPQWWQPQELLAGNGHMEVTARTCARMAGMQGAVVANVQQGRLQ